MLSTRTILMNALGIRCFASNTGGSGIHYPISTLTRKSIDDVLEPSQVPTKIEVSDEMRKVCFKIKFST